MPVPSLPYETLDSIFSYTTLPDLASLARTSSSYHNVSLRILYREISHMPPARTLRCVITLAARSDVAELVREFCLSGGSTGGGDDLFVGWGFWNLLKKALAGMVGLKNLTLGLGLGKVNISRLLSGTSFRRLEQLEVSCNLDSDLASFLITQPSITHLSFTAFDSPDPDPSEIVPLPPDALPNLRQLASSLPIASVLVPGRPITSLFLRLEKQHAASLDYYSSLALGTADINVVTLCPDDDVDMMDIGEAIRELSMYVPDLSDLLLQFGRSHKFEEATHTLPLFLSSLHNLRLLFILSPLTRAFHFKHSGFELLLAHKWARYSNSLEVIVFPNNFRCVRFGESEGESEWFDWEVIEDIRERAEVEAGLMLY